MGLLIKIESYTEDGHFEAAVHRDDGKVAKTMRYTDNEQAEFIQHVMALMAPELLVTGEYEAADSTDNAQAAEKTTDAIR